MEILIWQARHKGKRTISLRKLAKMTGIPKSTLWEIENGRKPADIIQLESIAKALNVKINDLFESDYK